MKILLLLFTDRNHLVIVKTIGKGWWRDMIKSTTGSAHSSKRGWRNWSWFPEEPGETNSVILFDQSSPVVPRSWESKTLTIPAWTNLQWLNKIKFRGGASLPWSQIWWFLSLTSMLDPQGLTVRWRTILAREKLDAPDSTKTSQSQVSSLLCANLRKKPPICIALREFLLLPLQHLRLALFSPHPLSRFACTGRVCLPGKFQMNW